MADTDLLLNGFSIIGDPHVNTNAEGSGNLMIHDGVSVFEDDDIIVLHVTNVTENGVLTDESVITGITVYDSASDYFNEVPLYTYSGTADINMGRHTMGDRYLNLDASGLTSTDSGAPVLDELAMVAGVDILGTLATTTGPIEVPTNEDLDIDQDGNIDPGEEGDSAFGSHVNLVTNICFARGTLIETPTGPRYVETLKEGDLVTTLDNGAQPIFWIGRKTVPGVGKGAPVEIAPGALGNIRKLVVSQNHRILVTGAAAELLFGEDQVLVAAKHLVDNRKIFLRPRKEIQYFHFLCEGHQIVFAEGCPAESLYPGSQTLDILGPEARAEILLRFPELRDPETSLALSRYTVTGREARALSSVA